MHLIWKRPDGFHGASPSDFSVFELDGHSRLWLHKTDKDQYPFRISGGWEDREATVRLNNLINLLPAPQGEWVSYLKGSYNHSMKDGADEFYDDIRKWLGELSGNLKGDTWEVEILSQALNSTMRRLEEAKQDFLKS